MRKLALLLLLLLLFAIPAYSQTVMNHAGGSPSTFTVLTDPVTSAFTIQDVTDPTKELEFDLSGMDTGTLAIIGFDADGRIITASLPSDLTYLGSSIDLTTEVSGLLPIASGGTGSATQNFVDLTTNQTIAGDKTFTGKLIPPQISGSTACPGGGIWVNTATGLIEYCNASTVTSVDQLTAGSGITITDGVIAATGGGGTVATSRQIPLDTISTANASATANIFSATGETAAVWYLWNLTGDGRAYWEWVVPANIATVEAWSLSIIQGSPDSTGTADVVVVVNISCSLYDVTAAGGVDLNAAPATAIASAVSVTVETDGNADAGSNYFKTDFNCGGTCDATLALTANKLLRCFVERDDDHASDTLDFAWAVERVIVNYTENN